MAALELAVKRPQSLAGKIAIVTAGPTVEPIDPVRFIANHSSGKQGYAIAAALAARGASVTLISGPVTLPAPSGLKCVLVQTAMQMQAAVKAALPADIAICTAAVADWRVADAHHTKLKKLDHPHIVSCIEMWKDSSKQALYIVQQVELNFEI